MVQIAIVGFTFTKILLNKKKDVIKGLSIKNDVAITDIKKEEIPLQDGSRSVLNFKFEFNSLYEPGIAEINIQGQILYSEDKKEIDKIIKSWKKNKDFPEKITGQIINTALLRCNVKVLSLVPDMNLPPHIRLPVIQQNKEKVKDYIG